MNSDEGAPKNSTSTGKGISLTSVREWIGLLSASAGLFAALLYLAGRSYSSGYFGAMNIPEYMVSFSLQEYGAVSWFPIFAYPAAMMAIGGLFWGVFYTVLDWLRLCFSRFVRWLRERQWGKSLGEYWSNWLGKRRWIKWLGGIVKFFKIIPLPKVGYDAHLMFALFWISIFLVTLVIFVNSTLSFVQQYGETNGKTAMLEKATLVELVATKPLMPEPVNMVTGPEGEYYVYKGFRLLHLNNGKYYLFKEIDPTTCKPRQIYIVDADQYKQVNLAPAVSLKDACKQNQPPQFVPTPTTAP